MWRGSIFLALWALSGCATTTPPWKQGHLTSLEPYYYQGIGSGPTKKSARDTALSSLIAYRDSIQIQQTTFVRQTEVTSTDGDKRLTDSTNVDSKQTIEGTVRSGTHIAEYWHDSASTWYAFALQPHAPNIEKASHQRLSRAQRRSFLPAWAQFAKSEPRKAWSILIASGSGVVGYFAFAQLRSHYQEQRDQVDTRFDPSGYDTYNNRATAAKWTSNIFGGLLLGSYIYSVVDGITHVPPTYRLLMSRADIRIDQRTATFVLRVPVN